MVADKPFGRAFLDVMGTAAAPVFYFTRLGGQPAGKKHFFIYVVFVDRSVVATIKGGLKSKYIILGTVFAYS